MNSNTALCVTLLLLLLALSCRSAWGEGSSGGGGQEKGEGMPIIPQTLNDSSSSARSCPVQLKPATSASQQRGVQAVLEKHETALLLLLGFGGFSMLLAILHNAVRKHVFHDQHNLDTTFDAGGNVSLSLTAVTVACQLFWPGDILHSATLTVKNGIAGPFWYAVGIIINIFIFPIFSVQFKTRAPGAKTYLQIIRARFGTKTHAVFCCFGLMTNVVITIGILLAGRATIQSLTKDASDEFAVLLMATLFGSYSLIGGLGTTFYVSYFNACLVFLLLLVFVVQVLHNSDDQWQRIGDTGKMYQAISCLQVPRGDSMGGSYVTFRSWGAFLYGVIEVFVSSAVTYCDQASWQSRIAAKPVQGVWGFLLAGFIWFSIPNVMAVTTGMAYLALSSGNATHLLTPGHLDEGLVTPLIAEKVLGSTGGILVLTMGAMALMSTGSGEVMALSSIIVYDIYQTYIQPFRKGLRSEQCVLCGKTKKELATRGAADNADDMCTCVAVYRCVLCSEDLSHSGAKADFSQTRPYTCPTHGRYRHYMDFLFEFKNWCIVMVTICIVPLGLLVFEAGIDLNWIFYVGAILTIPCFPPVVLSIAWVKATSQGLVLGSISGLVGGITAVLATATMYEGGLENFLINTVQDYAILSGTLCSFGLSLTGCVLGSLLTHRVKTEEDADREWMKIYCIDNPLHPWETNFQDELKGFEYEGRPSMSQMHAAFRSAKLTAYIGGPCCIGFFAVLLPAILSSVPTLDTDQFTAWLLFNQAWAVLMALIVVLAPPAEEILRIVRQCRRNHGLETGAISNNVRVTELVVKDVDHHATNCEFTAL
ncbi:uncharacterized protein LOC143299112 [Babylonia areolata]|uniref:uncharacterized protein LOC143299112 n=1 Tax=Babylonia areolata TaxID=304850 RepID=UPI003FD0DEFC